MIPHCGFPCPSLRTGLASFPASGSPLGTTCCITAKGPLLLGHYRLAHTSLLRLSLHTDQHVPNCLPLPCSWLSQPQTTTKAPSLVQHWSQADLLRSGELYKVPKFT
jgi:hypothetical protein